MDRATQEIRYQEWFTRIQGWSQSGLSKSEYCTQNGIPIKKDIHFYEMKEDEKNFGQIKAVDYIPN